MKDFSRFWTLCHGGAFLIAVLLLAFNCVEALPFPGDPRYGNAFAPLSDALTPWLSGALSILTEGGIPRLLYRPTGSLFFASLLNLNSSLYFIPQFFVSWLLISVITLYIIGGHGIKDSLLCFCIALTSPSLFTKLIGMTLPGALILGFPAFVMTFLGMILLAQGVRRVRLSTLELGLGLMVCSMAAILSGTLLFSLPLLLLIVLIAIQAPLRIRTAALLVFAVALPFIVELAIQRHFGLEDLYCVYSQPEHTYSATCDSWYHAHPALAVRVLPEYLTFLFSKTGITTIGGYFLRRIALDLSPLTNPVCPLTLTFGALISAIRRERHSSFVKALGRRSIPPLIFCAVLSLAPLQGSGQVQSIALSVVGIIGILFFLITALTARYYNAALFLVCYLLSVAFIAMVGLPYVGRIAGTFSWFLPFALFLFATEERIGGKFEISLHKRVPLLAIHVGVIAILYAGNTFFNGKINSVFASKVLNNKAALKLSFSEEKNRSLYYTGDRVLYYTKADDVPVGGVKYFDEISAPQGSGNTTLSSPATFIP